MSQWSCLWMGSRSGDHSCSVPLTFFFINWSYTHAKHAEGFAPLPTALVQNAATAIDFQGAMADLLWPNADFLWPKADFLWLKADFIRPKADILWPKADFLCPSVAFLWPNADFLWPNMTFMIKCGLSMTEGGLFMTKCGLFWPYTVDLRSGNHVAPLYS